MGAGSSNNTTAAPPPPPRSPPPPNTGAASVPPSSPPTPPPPHPLHQTDIDEEDENVTQLKECSTLYIALQDCLARTDRDWRSCQPQVQALKACHSSKEKR